VILFRLAFLPFRIGFFTGRVLGYRRLFVFGAGVATGILIASPDARNALLDAIERARQAADARRAPDEDPVAVVA
jgi:hypothetical protein